MRVTGPTPPFRDLYMTVLSGICENMVVHACLEEVKYSIET